jgi:hypothetical protein
MKNDARPRAPRATSQRDETRPQVTGAGLFMTREEWLKQLRPNDLVAVLVGTQRIEVCVVTSTSRTMITIGTHAKKVSFRRRDGSLVGRKPMGHLFHIEQP